MPKIPTFAAKGRPTAEVGSIKSNIKLDPTKTMAAAILPATQAIEEYYIKQRNLEEKTEANKKFFEIQNKVEETQEKVSKDFNENNAINTFNTDYNTVKNQVLSTSSNKRVKQLLETKLDIEYPEYLLTVKRNSRDALQTESLSMHNSSQNILMSKYYFADAKEKITIKEKLINNEIDLSNTWETGKTALDKSINAIESDLFIGDVQKNIDNKNYGTALALLKDVESSKFLDTDKRISLASKVSEGYKVFQNENNIDSILENQIGFFAKTGQFKDMDDKNIPVKDLEQGMVRLSQKTNANGQSTYTQPQLAEMSIRNNVTNPIHKEGINIGYSNLGITGDTEYLKQGYKLYKIYSTQQGRNFMRGTMKVDRAAIEMYDRMDYAINSRKLTEDQAIETLRAIQRDINLPEVQRKRVDNVLIGKATANVVDQNFSYKEAENVEFISDTIKRMANTVYKMGGSEEDAIEYAVNFIDENYYLNIFGNLVPAKTNRPAYHDTSLKFYIQELWDSGQINKEQNKLDDIIAIDVAPTEFSDVEGVRIINRRTRQPVTMFENAQGDFDENAYDAAVFTQKELQEKVYPLAEDDRFKKFQKRYNDKRDSVLAFSEAATLSP